MCTSKMTVCTLFVKKKKLTKNKNFYEKKLFLSVLGVLYLYVFTILPGNMHTICISSVYLIPPF